ncbi:MAG: magnesium chelatase subunit [Gaiellales bacterium]|nr:magnesium chelatase subunit [Gaiellales bacterium]
MTVAYPLSAIVGQEALIEALLVNAVAPEVGGVLVRGERGTAKSTAVRGLAPLLPPVIAARDQAFAFAPGEQAPGGHIPSDAPTESRAATLVELPLGASLDRLVGALDLGRALAGERAFEAGLLARAHQGILYVDEVNLLPDHLVDALLDAAASGVSRVERDAVSAVHDARFLLVGTMNVEEGELRPQLLDRFGLGVEVRAPREPSARAEIVRRRLAFEHDAAAFGRGYEAAERELAAHLAAARERYPRVRLPERELARITIACAKLGIDGVRGDIVCARAARALAALDGVDEVDEGHVRRAANLALVHRRRSDPLDGHAPADDDIERALDDPPPPPPPPGAAPPSSSERGDQQPAPAGDVGPARERRDPPAPARLPADALKLAGSGHGPSGRRAAATGTSAGSVDSRRAAADSSDVALVATLRARLTEGPDAGLREHVRHGRESVLLCLVVDASGSMGARNRLARVKGALMALLRDAYARRDRVAVIAFRDRAAQIAVRPGAPLETAAATIRDLPTGGRTPLAEGLGLAEQLIRRESAHEHSRRTIVVVLTDGRVADPDGLVREAAGRLARGADAMHVIDLEDGPIRLGLAAELAAAAGARLHTLSAAPTTSRAVA